VITSEDRQSLDGSFRLILVYYKGLRSVLSLLVRWQITRVLTFLPWL